MSAAKLLTDADVDRFPVSQAVEVMRTALRLHVAGHLTAPPRLSTAGLTFTVGSTPETFGFRVYHTRDASHDDQLVAVWNVAGQVESVVVGSALGPLRTSAIGAVAHPDASRLGLIGSGVQAKAHALAVATVRPLSQILIYSRDAAHREKLASELRALGLPATTAASTERVCNGSDLLTLATSSASPVIGAYRVQPGTHICTLGPKERGRHEFPPELAEHAALIVTDSLAQLGACSGGHILSGAAVRELGECVQNLPPRQSEDITLFLSVGLAGTEVVLARELFSQA